ncbi:antibiotic biosynthesis monooxygenase [Vibrio sp.]|uniref:Antibiotic biosynthesis monooxygenase n=1 Tax=Vibrio viridaestus TaxID=2487322 RepID=A0A3N9TM14_9VIBR|nr:putative quinol monooxygenase [Vibrio viridaestus]MDC0610575.1 antibiotic biosynthesis monooxygenase [Vibrio sp.]RQW65121.1 antibiotic biosynthesis monooxygenase [Vibrio viridaestus]
MSNVYLLAEIEAKPGLSESLYTLLTTLVTESRKEEGCITYELLQDIEKEELFIMREEWKSEQALTEHQQTPHFQYFVTTAQELNLLDKLDVKSFKIVA